MTTLEGQFFVHGTRMGDGIYTDNKGNDYIIDSGILAVVPSSLYLEQLSYPSRLSGKKINGFRDLGSIQNFSGEITVCYDRGTFTIASPADSLEVVIDT